VGEEHLVAVALLPAEQELVTEGDRWEVDEAAINIAQLNAAAGDPIDARLHLIYRRPNAHLNHRATGEFVAKVRVEVGRLQLILVGATWQGAHALEAAEAQQVILHALEFDALVAEEADDRAQPGQLLRCRVNRP
jgi:transposase-like protein